MTTIERQPPQIVTIETLNTFKNQILDSIGIAIGKTTENAGTVHSIIQVDNPKILKVSNSAAFGTGHIADTSKQGLKNILVSGQGNIVNSWNQTVIGTFNKPVENTLFVIGNGSGETQRQNILEVFRDGKVNINNVELSAADTAKTLNIDGKLQYLTTDIPTENWTDFINKVGQLADNELVPATIIKKLTGVCDSLERFNVNSVGSWSNNLVQSLTYDKENHKFSYESVTAGVDAKEDAKTKALSVASGLDLVYEIYNYAETNLLAEITDVRQQIELLRRQVSYLISCLTVDKISDGQSEFYTVGIADYALDKNTQFKIDNSIETYVIDSSNKGE